MLFLNLILRSPFSSPNNSQWKLNSSYDSITIGNVLLGYWGKTKTKWTLKSKVYLIKVQTAGEECDLKKVGCGYPNASVDRIWTETRQNLLILKYKFIKVSIKRTVLKSTVVPPTKKTIISVVEVTVTPTPACLRASPKRSGRSRSFIPFPWMKLENF
jgi:hypothetical protein